MIRQHAHLLENIEPAYYDCVGVGCSLRLSANDVLNEHPGRLSDTGRFVVILPRELPQWATR